MLQRVKIKLTRPLLGDKRTSGNLRRFQRDKSAACLELEPDFWFWTVRQAIIALGHDVEVDESTISVPGRVEVPSLVLYTHGYYGRDGRRREDQFECIRSGALLTFEILITESREKDGRRAPTVTELRSILSFVGKHLGISPWGSKFNFGRFELLELETKIRRLATEQIDTAKNHSE